MHRQTLSQDALPAWAQAHHVEFNGISVDAIPSKGTGLVVTASVAEKAPLMLVPKDLILSLEQVWIHAKADRHLREVLEAMGDYARVKHPAFVACFGWQSLILISCCSHPGVRFSSS